MTVVDPPLTPAALRVLEAASRLFYERGIHAVGVDTIAEAAGVTKKTLYDRFGSKEALVVAYLKSRDDNWRAHLDTHLARVPDAGAARILAIFDAAIAWSSDNSPKGCSAINARAEIGVDNGGSLLPEVSRQKAWLLGLFADLSRGAGTNDPEGTARMLMLLYEGAIVTLGMGTFPNPFALAREMAETVLAAALDSPTTTAV